jgi:hypothetical protein
MMIPPGQLFICGASTRAAAFSAQRAHLLPWCADLFGDRDLEACCPSLQLPFDEYPRGFLELAKQGPPGPWMYTGGLENWGNLVNEITSERPLWGNGGDVLRLARSPFFVASLLHAVDVPCPLVHERPEEIPQRGRWLAKPIRGAGGANIHFWTGQAPNISKRKRVYFQEYIEGQPCAAIYLGDGRQAQLLGVTRQLVGEIWLHAAPFHYCGSIGPLPLDPSVRAAFERLGTALVRGCHLRGLFGVDGVVRDDIPWPVEINPRYTASVEVLEYATGIRALAWHRKVFDPTAPVPPAALSTVLPPVVGKAILFAKAPLTLPHEGPWLPTLQAPVPHQDLPAFADIPRAGQHIEAGRPILTLFARADSPTACLDSLRQTAQALDRWLFSR